MPAAEVELHDGSESLGRVFYIGDREEHLRMAHETINQVSRLLHKAAPGQTEMASYLVIRSSILRGSRMKVGRTTRLRSAPGRSWEMMCMSTGLA